MNKGKLLIISGFSGVGKGTVVKYMLDNFENYMVSVSATTREPRDGEENGIHYYFTSEKEFEQMISNNQLLEYANYVGHYYGTPREFVEKKYLTGKNVILEIEIQGALQVKKAMPEAMLIFLLPPDGETLKNRLVGRNTESKEVIKQRLCRAAEEIKEMEQYDYFVLNDQVDNCAANIDKIVTDNNPEQISSDCIEQIKKDILGFSKGE